MTKVGETFFNHSLFLSRQGKRERRPVPAGDFAQLFQDARFAPLKELLTTEPNFGLTLRILDTLPVFLFRPNEDLPLTKKKSLFIQQLLYSQLPLQNLGFNQAEINQSYHDLSEQWFRDNEPRLHKVETLIRDIEAQQPGKTFPEFRFTPHLANQRRASLIRQAYVYDIVQVLAKTNKKVSVDNLLAQLPEDAFLPNADNEQKIQGIRDTIKKFLKLRVIKESPINLTSAKRREMITKAIHGGRTKRHRVTSAELQTLTGASASTIAADKRALKDEGRLREIKYQKELDSKTKDLLEKVKDIISKYPNEGGIRTISNTELLRQVNALEGFEDVGISKLNYILTRYGSQEHIPQRLTGDFTARVREIVKDNSGISNAELTSILQAEGFDTNQRKVGVTRANLPRLRRGPRN